MDILCNNMALTSLLLPDILIPPSVALLTNQPPFLFPADPSRPFRWKPSP